MPIDPNLMNAAAEIDGEANADTIAIREQPQEKESNMSSYDMMFMAFNSVNVLLQKNLPHWAFTLEEINQLAPAWAKVIDKHYPKLEMSPEWNAIGCTAIIVAPKFAIHEQIRREKLDAEKRRQQQGEPSRTSISNVGARQITPHQKPQPVDEKTPGDNLGSAQRPQPEPVAPDEHAATILSSANLPE
jgi:hypothetical protein